METRHVVAASAPHNADLPSSFQRDDPIAALGGLAGRRWIDNLRRLGREPIGIAFSGRAADPRYDNKRTEMYFEAVDWIRKGGALPPGPTSQELIAALSRTTYSFRGDRLPLEPKDQVKARLGYSLDDADAFALTFAQPVAARDRFYDRTMEAVGMRRRWRRGRAITDYDPLDG